MIKLIIIEDEIELRETNRFLLQNNFPNIKIVGEAGTVNESIAIIKEKKPDIVLLDIELKDGNCFQVLQACRPFTFRPVFITAYNQYAIKAIKFSAIDYLLKPVNEFEFCNAINEAIKRIDDTDLQQQTSALEEQYFNPQTAKKIVLKTTESLHLTDINDIIYCKSDNSYTSFFLSNKKEIIVSKSIKEYAEMLEHYGFIRPHQSYLVNINFIDKIENTNGGGITLRNKVEIPVSKRLRQFVLEKMERI